MAEEKDIYARHEKLAQYTREELQKMGLRLYGKDGFSNTVSVFYVPDGFSADEILHAMRQDYGIMIAGSFDVFAGKLLRIGHMGENANEGAVRNTLQALKEIIDKKSHIL